MKEIIFRSYTLSFNKWKKRVHSVTSFMRLQKLDKSITRKEIYRITALMNTTIKIINKTLAN